LGSTAAELNQIVDDLAVLGYVERRRTWHVQDGSESSGAAEASNALAHSEDINNPVGGGTL
jgi:hypothetical protein